MPRLIFQTVPRQQKSPWLRHETVVVPTRNRLIWWIGAYLQSGSTLFPGKSHWRGEESNSVRVSPHPSPQRGRVAYPVTSYPAFAFSWFTRLLSSPNSVGFSPHGAALRLGCARPIGRARQKPPLSLTRPTGSPTEGFALVVCESFRNSLQRKVDTLTYYYCVPDWPEICATALFFGTNHQIRI
jgi:hypothetical protein